MCVARQRARVGRSVHLSAKSTNEDNDLDHGTSVDFDEYDALLSKYPYRTVLVPDVADPHLQQLLSSQTPSELFSCISKLGTPCPLVYAAQAVVSLWDLKKLSDSSNKSFDATAALDSPEFNTLMNQLHRDCSSLSDTCLTAVLVSLKRLLHEPAIPVYHALLSEAYLRCSSFNLQDLSRFIVSLNQSRNVTLAYQCLAMERLQHLLPLCATEQELKCAAISLRRLVHLSSPSLIAAFCSKASEILTPASQVHTLLRCLPVTCLEPQHNRHDSCMVKVLTYMNALIDCLDPVDLASLADIVGEAQCNANDTLKLIQERARQLYRQEPSISVAHSLVMGPSLQQRERLEIESSLHKLLDSDISHRSVVQFADITVWLPVTNEDILASFWSIAADLSNPSLVSLIRRYLTCYQQTHFRSMPFESVLLEWSKEKLESAWKLGSVTLAAQCLLMLERSAIGPGNVERLISLLGQVSSWSLLELSLGLKAAERLSAGAFSRRHTLPPLLMDLKTNVHGEIRRRVETTETLTELTALTVSNRILWLSRGHHEELKESIASRCAVLVDSGSPRELASFFKALSLERLWLPDCLNRTVSRAVEEPEWLFPVTLCQLPYACFVSGHVPDRVEQLAKVVNSSVLR
ncbi:hypothetical protein V5799_004047 [Amblyomma americanum]|uniref:Uncharacterized protein n=1 Tax=Amblyomma americanum TaxID=6943 RepID=A0AAQ4D777_AMBAM